jgi:hypothetical protein
MMAKFEQRKFSVGPADCTKDAWDMIFKSSRKPKREEPTDRDGQDHQEDLQREEGQS